ncbi:MAG TPA: pyridoxal-phosphate dependent enzyme [Chthonomonadales bacterium]|nr:pyridoxal-phosphate dependent enzyme [Chthonomonadales bacterium]
MDPRDGPRPTTVIESSRLNARLGERVVLVSETFQWTGSFKYRAAYHLASRVPNPRILTASSGNFGQALAMACRLRDKGCTVVMPDLSSRVKIDAVREQGATVDLIDTRAVSRAERVGHLSAADPEAYVASPYDDPLVIEGNATLGAEIAALPWNFDEVLVPVGGGGLAAGIVTGLEAAGRAVPVVGVEPALANDAARSLRAGRIVANETEPATVADGARTLSLGRHNWDILSTRLDGIVEVSEQAIEHAVALLFQLANLKAEPTGALALAAIVADPGAFRRQCVCCVVSGGNVDAALYARLVTAA